MDKKAVKLHFIQERVQKLEQQIKKESADTNCICGLFFYLFKINFPQQQILYGIAFPTMQRNLPKGRRKT